jgi:glucokinase
MRSVLLGDIGGTHSRFALTGDGHGKPAEVREYADDDFTTFDAAVAHYLREVGAKPDAAVLAIAAPINGGEISMTNRGWRFRLDDLAAAFGFERVRAINDFEAQAWALTRVGADDLQSIGDAGGHPDGPKVVLGPGTGLGVAALVPREQGPVAIPTEAGHISFGPAAADEEPVFARLRRDAPVSAETVLSGPGLVRLHAALHPDAGAMTAAAIVGAAQAGSAQSLATTRMFVRLLGRFAGDMMLTFAATGGVYISGGVAQALGGAFDAAAFRAGFEAHPPYAAMLAATPTCLVIHPQPGLLGCAAIAERFLAEMRPRGQ